MEKIFEKISSYNILNNLLPGATVCFLINYVAGVNIIRASIVDNLFIFYFVGMIISRIGSIVIEPICKKIKFVTYSDYKDYISACKNDVKIETLLEVNNMYRTFFSGCLFVLLVWGYNEVGQRHQILLNIAPEIIVVLLIVLFAFSYRKQTKYIKSRVEKIKSEIKIQEWSEMEWLLGKTRIKGFINVKLLYRYRQRQIFLLP